MHDAICIDPEFHDLIPPLSPEERSQLEENLKADGCRDPLVVWRGLLLDGHNRYEICERLNLPYSAAEMPFADRDTAKAWIIRNQFGRRNLSSFQRAELALKLKPLLAAEGKANQRTSTGGPSPQLLQKSGKAGLCADKRLAEIAGVSHYTIHKASVVLEEGSEEAKERLRRGESSVNKEYFGLRPRREMVNTKTGEVMDEADVEIVTRKPAAPKLAIEKEVCRLTQELYQMTRKPSTQIVYTDLRRTAENLKAAVAKVFTF